MTDPTVSQVLSRYVRDLTYEGIPPEIIAQAKRCILDQLGCQLRGGTVPWLQPIYWLGTHIGGPPESTVVYHGDRITASYAAYVNGSQGQGSETDDQTSSGGHIGAAVVPSAMAVAEMVGAGGKDFLRAVVAGYEVMMRTGRATMGPGKRSFHTQGINGVFGAATAAGVLLDLSPDQMAHALGIAASHSSSINEYNQTGGEVKRAHAGIANRGGVQSALLAQQGLTAPPTIFEGKRGWLFALGSLENGVQAIVGDLGKSWRINEVGFKPYPTYVMIHAPLDALNLALGKQQFDPSEIEEISVGLSEQALETACAIRHPQEVVGAQFSMPFSFALRIVRGQNDLTDYMNPALWKDPTLLGVVDKVRPYAMPEADRQHERKARVVIRLRDGRTLQGSVETGKGTPGNPMSRDEMRTKFRMLASGAVSDARMDQIVGAVDRLETLPKVSDLVSLLVREDSHRRRR